MADAKDLALKKLVDLEVSLAGVNVKGAAALKKSIQKKKDLICTYHWRASELRLLVEEAERDVKGFSA